MLTEPPFITPHLLDIMAHVRSRPIVSGIAFITGGARGLGNAVARSFARDGATGIALIDIQDDEVFARGRAAVEELGVRVCITFACLQCISGAHGGPHHSKEF